MTVMTPRAPGLYQSEGPSERHGDALTRHRAIALLGDFTSRSSTNSPRLVNRLRSCSRPGPLPAALTNSPLLAGCAGQGVLPPVEEISRIIFTRTHPQETGNRGNKATKRRVRRRGYERLDALATASVAADKEPLMRLLSGDGSIRLEQALANGGLEGPSKRRQGGASSHRQ